MSKDDPQKIFHSKCCFCVLLPLRFGLLVYGLNLLKCEGKMEMFLGTAQPS